MVIKVDLINWSIGQLGKGEGECKNSMILLFRLANDCYSSQLVMGVRVPLFLLYVHDRYFALKTRLAIHIQTVPGAQNLMR